MINILIIDDEETLLELLVDALARHYNDGKGNVYCAGSASDAMTLFKERSYDIIVMDVMLGGVCGIGLVEEMKEVNTDKDFPGVIYSTGIPDGIPRIEGEVVIRKPYDMDILIEAIEANKKGA